jgi:hypothetical protein
MNAERIANAIRTINKYHDLGDAIYDVRNQWGGEPVEGVPYTGDSWEHPIVTEYNDAVMALKEEGVLK